MFISDLAKVIHENAVAHGWWDEEREPLEINALIHSEWSEALEEARAGKPMVYRLCLDCDDGPCDVEPDVCTACGFKAEEHKPEGVAVELIDGCIRILDYMGKLEADIQEIGGQASEIEGLYTGANVAKVPEKLPELVAHLHLYTSQSIAARSYHDLGLPDIFALTGAMAAALSWVKKQRLDPLAILLQKHEYNKTRPYKHGKKF